MIEIKHPIVSVSDSSARMSAEVLIAGGRHELWIEVAREFEKFLCPERGDAFVLAFIQYALQRGENITSEAPLTDRLYDGLVHGFLPAFNKVNGLSLSVIAPVASEVDKPLDANGRGFVGTGCSCGVDSLHVYAMHPDVDCGCVWNAHGVDVTANNQARVQLFDSLRKRAASFCDSCSKKLLVADSNFDSGCVEGLKWDGMTTFGNLFHIYALQKFFRKYYIASDCDINDFRFKIKSVYADPARYEYFLFPFISLNNLSIEMDGADKNRVEKIKDMKDYLPARRYLNVCHRINEGHRNGSYDCAKCMRTMLELDCCGVLEEYREVFDVAYYHKHFHEYIAEYYRGLLQKDNFMLELKPYISKWKIPLKVRAKAIDIVLHKAGKKILRGGKTATNVSFSSRG